MTMMMMMARIVFARKVFTNSRTLLVNHPITRNKETTAYSTSSKDRVPKGATKKKQAFTTIGGYCSGYNLPLLSIPEIR
uniref:Putative secreted peptide n=1 Tax=Anopheles braziliensis TaxID=58242 RepID=A0A2M3ZN16_9DIPT